MAKVKKETTAKAVVEQEPRYKGYQLLKLPEYDNRIGRIVLKPDKEYTMAEADNLIKNY